jgi:phage terminase Nu1 subunit (DNA packaging protein)
MTTPKSVKKPRRAGARRPGRPASPTSARAWRTRKEAALAQLRELQLERERGDLLDADDVARRWEEVAREVRSAVLACTSRIRAALPHLTAADGDLIDRELRAALVALAEAPCTS